ncbi:MAG: GNAT family N-acetyltransferase [Planctomycetia bacterium]|nr:GNAT family N-acetyltransferase [Planctomycetia bacterium]
MTELVIEQLTPRDEREAVESLTEAFVEYPLLVALCPNAKRRPRATEAFCRMLLRLSVRAEGAFATADRAAVACALPPGREWPSEWAFMPVGAISLAWRLGWRGTRLLKRLERGFDDTRAKHIGKRPHWYLYLLGVRPEMQRKGLSRAVLQPLFEIADRDKLPIYLETMTETNVPIYQKLGFELLGFSELSEKLPNWEMLREPR